MNKVITTLLLLPFISCIYSYSSNSDSSYEFGTIRQTSITPQTATSIAKRKKPKQIIMSKTKSIYVENGKEKFNILFKDINDEIYQDELIARVRKINKKNNPFEFYFLRILAVYYGDGEVMDALLNEAPYLNMDSIWEHVNSPTETIEAIKKLVNEIINKNA